MLSSSPAGQSIRAPASRKTSATPHTSYNPERFVYEFSTFCPYN
jgi:hypothetical protein